RPRFAPSQTYGGEVVGLLLIMAVGLWTAGCHRPTDEGPSSRPLATRGVIVVSVDTLRADHLGAYGYDRDTSPQLDALAQESVVFEHAYAQAPSTLVSHMSIFTSLFPAQHGVVSHGQTKLAESIPTFPQRFHDAGFRTGGHTEGGYVAGGYGFDRGFDEWRDPDYDHSTDIEETVDRGLAFLADVGADESFLLFLHTYSVHDPYEPPDPWRHRFWTDEPPTYATADAATLRAANDGTRPIVDGEAAYFASRYDDGIRYADVELGRFLDGIDRLGLRDEVTLVVTSDHGEEFREHGKYLHTQLYPPVLHVPLLVRHPELEPARVEAPVRSIDIAPTLLDLFGLEPLPGASGQSLVPFLEGGVAPEPPGPVFAEVSEHGVYQRTLVAGVDAGLRLLAERGPAVDPEGVWVGDAVDFDVVGPRVGLQLRSFHRPRRVTLRSDDDGVLFEDTIPTSWAEHTVRIPPTPDGGTHRRLRLVVGSCDRPSDVSGSGDARCLGVQVAQPSVRTFELYDLSGDRPARIEGDTLIQDLATQLESLRWAPVAAPGSHTMDDEQRRALEALGYL
ncbi:MAG: sulfatase, partial [Acidobacteriota bacterium]